MKYFYELFFFSWRKSNVMDSSRLWLRRVFSRVTATAVAVEPFGVSQLRRPLSRAQTLSLPDPLFLRSSISLFKAPRNRVIFVCVTPPPPPHLKFVFGCHHDGYRVKLILCGMDSPNSAQGESSHHVV